MDESTRFRLALNNPIVMLGLCLLAGVAVYHNIMGANSDPTQPFSSPSSSDEEVAPSTIVTPSPSTHEEAATHWHTHPTRDPFAPMTVAQRAQPSVRPSASSQPFISRPPISATNSLALKAVAIEAQQRSAVINRHVVYEGDIIEGYHVVSIQLKGVWLTRHGKKEFLTFSKKTMS
ncbi:MAG: hypothetical protein OEZ05_16320 [Nitrospirota bacterium]|nr:hypothetical protein [Nitrospirota bacterium]